MSILNFLEKAVDQFYSMIPRHTPDVSKIKNARIVAHRGAHSPKQLIENTLPAFEKAYQLGCFGIELDIHETSDSDIVVNHDPTLKRLWQQDLMIKETPLSVIREKAPMVPTLDEVIQQYAGKIHLFIEIKEPLKSHTKLNQILNHLKPVQDYHLISLNQHILQNLEGFPKESLLLVADFNKTQSFVKQSIEKPYGGVLGHYLLLTKHKTKQLKSHNQLTGVGFIDSKNNLYRALNQDIDYIFTNQARYITNLTKVI